MSSPKLAFDYCSGKNNLVSVFNNFFKKREELMLVEHDVETYFAILDKLSEENKRNRYCGPPLAKPYSGIFRYDLPDDRQVMGKQPTCSGKVLLDFGYVPCD